MICSNGDDCEKVSTVIISTETLLMNNNLKVAVDEKAFC